MSISSEEEKIDVDSRIHAAETFYSMGLLTEALEAYQEILEEIQDLPADKRKLVEDKVESIGKEVKHMDENDKDVSDLSDKELNLIRQTLVTKGKGDVAQIISSGFALRELGLFNEALAEYEKLLATDHPKIKTALEMMECLLKTNPPEHAVLYLQEILAKNGVEAKEKASLNKKLGPELEKRGHLNLQQLFAKHAAEAEKKEGGQILQKRTGAPGAAAAPSDKKDLSDEKKSHLIAKKRGQKPETKETEAAPAKSPLPPPSSGSKYDYLIGEKLVDLEQLQKALAMSKKMKKSVEQVLIEQFAIDKEEIGKSLTAYSGCPFKSYDKDIPIPYELIGNLKKAFLLNDLWIPLKLEPGWRRDSGRRPQGPEQDGPYHRAGQGQEDRVFGGYQGGHRRVHQTLLRPEKARGQSPVHGGRRGLGRPHSGHHVRGGGGPGAFGRRDRGRILQQGGSIRGPGAGRRLPGQRFRYSHRNRPS